MPEGPETRRMADGLSKAVKKKDLISYQFLHPNIDTLNNLKGIKIIDISSLGKTIITRLNIGKSIMTHNQLYGKWTINLTNTVVKHNRKLRIEYKTSKKIARLWSATDIVLLETEKENTHHYIKNLGPDVLNDFVTIETITNQLESKKFRNRNLGGLLLNQNFIAGLGNYLRSEILFFSGLLPMTRPSDLDENQIYNLSNSIKCISMRAYHQKGNTIDKDDFSKRFGNIFNFRLIRHMVFGRKDQPCFNCSNKIIKFVQNSRRLYYCSACQT